MMLIGFLGGLEVFGLAGLLAVRSELADDEQVVVVFTGRRWDLALP